MLSVWTHHDTRYIYIYYICGFSSWARHTSTLRLRSKFKMIFLSIQNPPKICVLAEEPKVSQSSRRVGAWERTSKWTCFYVTKAMLDLSICAGQPLESLVTLQNLFYEEFHVEKMHRKWATSGCAHLSALMKKYWKMISLTIFQEMLRRLAWLKARKTFNLFRLSSPRTTSPNNLLLNGFQVAQLPRTDFSPSKDSPKTSSFSAKKTLHPEQGAWNKMLFNRDTHEKQPVFHLSFCGSIAQAFNC